MAGRPLSLFPLVALLFLAAALGGAAGGVTVHFLDDDDSDRPSTVSESTDGPQPTSAADSPDADVAGEAAQSVVTIVNELLPARNTFGDALESVAVGSGVIVHSDGFIVTNEHVVRNAARLTVVMPGGEEHEATLVAADDPFTDLAVIKIDASGLPALRWGDSDALRPGEKVIAIGTALHEFEGSVTVGVVSGLHRRWAREGVVMEDLVQTDAAINHGNSGGALINSRGELVGINSTIIRSTDGGDIVEGIGFAISSKVAMPIVDAMIAEGRYPRAYLGIAHQDIDPSLVPLGLLSDRGALVLRVSPDTPAEEAGLLEGDIILRMGDIDLTPDMPFINALGRLAPDAEVDFLVNRGGEEMTLRVKLVARDR